MSFGVRVLPCRATPGVEVYGYAPQFNKEHFSHVFEHESEYTVPGTLLNASLLSGGVQPDADVVGKIQVHIERTKPDRLIMGLVLKVCLESKCILKKPIFEHTEIPGETS